MLDTAGKQPLRDDFLVSPKHSFVESLNHQSRFGEDVKPDEKGLDSETAEMDEINHSNSQLAKGKAKVIHNMLGLLQSLVLRRDQGCQAETVQLSQSASVLPKANTATIRSRLRKWSPFTSEGCSDHFGGELLEEELRKLKLIGVVRLVSH